MPTLLKDLITIPEHVTKGDFVLELTEGTDPAKVKATLDSYVVTKQLAACFDESLKLVQSALQGSSKAAYLHGSLGSGKSHFMAVLNFLLGGNADARSIKELGDVVAKHNEWLTGKKFLMVPVPPDAQLDRPHIRREPGRSHPRLPRRRMPRAGSDEGGFRAGTDLVLI